MRTNYYYRNPDLAILHDFFKVISKKNDPNRDDALQKLYIQHKVTLDKQQTLNDYLRLCFGFDEDMILKYKLIPQGYIIDFEKDFFKTATYSVLDLCYIFVVNPFSIHNVSFDELLNLIKYFTNILHLKIILNTVFKSDPKVLDDFNYSCSKDKKFYLNYPKNENDLKINCKVISKMFREYHTELGSFGAIVCAQKYEQG